MFLTTRKCKSIPWHNCLVSSVYSILSTVRNYKTTKLVHQFARAVYWFKIGNKSSPVKLAQMGKQFIQCSYNPDQQIQFVWHSKIWQNGSSRYFFWEKDEGKEHRYSSWCDGPLFFQSHKLKWWSEKDRVK